LFGSIWICHQFAATNGMNSHHPVWQPQRPIFLIGLMKVASNVRLTLLQELKWLEAHFESWPIFISLLNINNPLHADLKAKRDS
jgi:hypothetical protein